MKNVLLKILKYGVICIGSIIIFSIFIVALNQPSNVNNIDALTTPSHTPIATQSVQNNIVQSQMGEDIELTTIKLKVNKCRESNMITSKYSTPKLAKPDTKFIIINLNVTNITKEPFDLASGMLLVDNFERKFDNYSETIGNIDNYLDYITLSPSIKVTGNYVYEIPSNATSYSLMMGKGNSNIVYSVKLK